MNLPAYVPMHGRKLLRRILQYWPLFPHFFLVVLLLWLSSSFPLTCPLFAFASALFYLYIVDTEQKKWLRARLERTCREEERAHLHHCSQDDSVEAWLNVLLHACWPAWEAGPICRTLEARLVELLEPKNVVVERIRLGASPPLVRSCTMWLPRSDQHHHEGVEQCDAALDMDLSYVAGDDMGVVLTVPVGYFGAKLFCDNLKIDCKLRLGLKFVAYFPYVSYLSVASLTVPKLSLSVRPLSSNSLAVTDLPMIASWVTNSLHMAIQTCGLVHPEKWEFDFIQWWGTDFGFGPTLSATNGECYAILEILEGKNLMAKDFSGFSDPYVIVTHGNQKFKTQTRKQTLNPTWHECFQLKLTSEASWNEKVLLRCRDRDLFIDDELGFYELDLKAYRNGKRCEMLCKLEDADSGELLIAISVVSSQLHSKHVASDKNATAAVQVALTHKNEVLNIVGHSAAEPRSRRQGKAPEDADDNLVPMPSSSADANLCSITAEMAIASAASSNNYLQPENVDKGNDAVQATVSSPSGMAQRLLSGSILFCPSDVHTENVICDKDVVSSSTTPVASSSSSKKVNAMASRPRKSIVPDGKKGRRNTLNPPLQSRRSTVFANSSIGRGSTSTQSLKKTRSIGASENIILPQVEKASHSKTWKRNLFQFAFHRHKQKRLSQL
ncbi:hypothetical protein GOP47_0020870 [Adiantum capillus-veneris]|uniref:C2 domain-containing protein n=1 Tax=Adiantum capillus-veneris TaxID=13818 RepID=A0A9D4UAI0_ADICA|nr:hypothetical protein GOP47_0020870 [Adiantum capillus-veneris]